MNHHKNPCQAIFHLGQRHFTNISKQTTFNTQLLKEKAKLINAIGDECNLHCKLNNYYCKLLLDKGLKFLYYSKICYKKHIKIWNIGLKRASWWWRQIKSTVVKYHTHTICWMGQLKNSAWGFRYGIIKCTIPCDIRLHWKDNLRL